MIAGPGAGAGKVNRPNGAAVDQSSGALYVAEDNNRRISKFDSEGNFLLAWGWGVADGTSQELQVCGPAAEPPTKRCFTASSLGSSGPGSISPSAVAVDQSSGAVYVTDAAKRRVTKFNPEGGFLFMVGKGVNKGGGTPANPGNLCAAEHLANGDSCGAGSAGVGPNEFTNPLSLAVDASSQVWVGDTDRIASFGPGAAPGAEVELPGAGNTTSLAVDSAGDFFTARRETLERQGITFAGFANGDTFTLGNLPAHCSGASTDPIVNAGSNEKGEGVTRENILEALEAKCGTHSFSLNKGGFSHQIFFEDPFAGVDEPLLSCAKASGSGSCSVTGEADGKLGKVEKLEAGTGAVAEELDKGGRPRAIALDGEDNLYVGDVTFPYRLIKFDPEGEKVSQFGAGQVVGEPLGNALAVDEGAQTLYAASSRSGAESVVQAFAIPAPGPAIEDQRAEDVLPTTATLAAALNPEGHETEYHFEYGASESYGQSTEARTLEAEGSPDEGYEQREVSAALKELIPGTTYHFRLVAGDSSNPSCPETGEECAVEGPDATFTTLPAVGIGAQWASEVAARSATLNAELDPLGAEGAKWWVEYGLGEAFDRESAHEPLSGPVERHVALTGLAPGTTYNFRFVAEGAHDGTTYTVLGAARSFTTQRGGLGFSLPDSRAWEMVSPSNKHGGEIDTRGGGEGQIQAAISGDAVAYLSRGSIEANPEGNRGLDESSVLSRRAPGGQWSSEDITPPHTHVTPTSIGRGLEYKLFSLDLGRGLLEPRDATSLSPLASERAPYLRANSEPPMYKPLVSAANALPGFGGKDEENLGGVSVAAASADLSHVIVESEAPLLEEKAPGGALYAWSEGAAPPESLKPASVLPSGELVAAEAGGLLLDFGPKHHAISEDGARAFWSSNAAGLYVRDLAREETARLDEVQEGAFGGGSASPLFQGAAADGGAALFTDSRELTADASDASEGGRDLYRCELAVSEKGELGCELDNLSGAFVQPGESARVLGLISGMSEDATRAYFVARGVLDGTPNGEGDAAVSGAPNLYVWQEGAGARFVARLSEEDDHNWGTITRRAFEVSAAASPSGRYLAFMSKLPLTGYDNRDAASGERAQEVFRYDAVADELICASCNPSGARPQALRPSEPPLARYFDPQGLWSDEGHGEAVAALLPEATKLRLGGHSLYRPRAVHDNGRVFFNAADSLVPADSNGDGDVYQYEPLGVGDCSEASGGAGVALSEGGCVALISSGGPGGTAAFLDASVGGDDVFFFTPAKLSVTDEDEATDVYDARVDGIAATAAVSAECQGEACQPPPAAPPTQTPASAAFRGPGNPGTAGACAGLSRRAERLRRIMARHGAPGATTRRLARRARSLSEKAKRCRARARAEQRSNR